MRGAALFPALLLPLCLTACISGRRYGHPPVAPKVRGTGATALRQCIATLDTIVARYALLPDRTFSGGCSASGSIQLRDIGTPVTNLGSMTCGLGYAITLWVQSDLQIPAMGEFRSPVPRVETMGSYSCRNINGAATGKLSEHAYANAVDVSAFVLKDGRRISVLDGWNGDRHEARFLRSIRAAACARFNTVLSPDYHAEHHDQLHFDMGRRPFCR